MKIQPKLLFPLIILTIIPLMIMGLLAYYYASNTSREHLIDGMEEIGATAKQVITTKIASTQANAELFAKSRLIQQYMASGETRYELIQPTLLRQLSDYQNTFPDYYEIRILLPDGDEDVRVINKDIRNQSFEEKDTDLFRYLSSSAANNIRPFLSINPDNGELSTYITEPLISKDLQESEDATPQERLAGYLVITLNLDFLQQLSNSVKIGKEGFLMVASASRGLLFKPSKISSPPAIPASFYSGFGNQHFKITEQKTFLIGGLPLFDDLHLITIIPKSEVVAEARIIALWVFGLIIAVILIMVFLAYQHIHRLLLAPIFKLKRIVNQIGQGNLDHPLPESHKLDEFGELYKSIHQMTSRLKESQERIKKLAFYDELTGLPNRLTLKRELENLIADSKRSGKIFAVVFLDLDNFKDINDALGHGMGDRLLKEVGKRIQHNSRASDFLASSTELKMVPDNQLVARLGGDEFTFLLKDVNSISTVSKVVNRILRALRKPIMLNNHEAFASASIGIAMFPQDGSKADTLLKNADTAMYEAKNNGKNSFEFFSENMNRIAIQRLAMETNLRKALSKDEFYLHYQPRIDTRTKQVEGFEALIRWQNEEMGFVPPSEFIPLAEESILICEIGFWVLDSACKQIKQWVAMGYKDICVSVNLSPMQIYRGDTYNMIKTLLSLWDIKGHNLEIEITESGLLKNESAAIEFLNKVRALGVRIALDDFGTGYSSLSYLRKLPIDILKIDRSFVVDVCENENTASVIESIIELAKKLSLATVAEGLEEENQVEQISRFGCDYIQGYFYSKPLPVDEAEDFLKHSAHSPDIVQNA